MEKLKALFVGDLHIHPHARDWSRVTDALEAFAWALDVYEKEGCNHLFFLGDWQHNKRTIHSSIAYYSQNLLAMAAERGVRITMITGNHDCPLIVNPDYSYGWLSNDIAHVLDRPFSYQYEDCDVYAVPFYGPADRLRKVVMDVIAKRHEITKNKPAYFLGHLDVIGGRMAGNHKSDHGLTPTVLNKNFDWSFLGHYHVRHQIGSNIQYVGSLLTTRHNEEGPRGVTVFENGEMKFIQNTFSPKHITLTVPEICKETCYGNFVRVRISDDQEPKELTRKIQAFGPRRIELLPSVTSDLFGDEEEGQLVFDRRSDELSEHAILDNWVNMACPPNLDKNRLLDEGKDILEEVGI